MLARKAGIARPGYTGRNTRVHSAVRAMARQRDSSRQSERLS